MNFVSSRPTLRKVVTLYATVFNIDLVFVTFVAVATYIESKRVG